MAVWLGSGRSGVVKTKANRLNPTVLVRSITSASKLLPSVVGRASRSAPVAGVGWSESAGS